MKVTDKAAPNLTAGAKRPVDQANETSGVDPIRTSASRSEAQATGSRVTLSTELEEVGQIAEQAKTTPEVRQDLVDKIRAELDAGEMEIDLDLLAGRMLQDLTGIPGSEE